MQGMGELLVSYLLDEPFNVECGVSVGCEGLRTHYLLDDPFNKGSSGRLPLLLVLLQNRLHMVPEQEGLQEEINS